jgi:hypothetical protein
MKHTLDFVKIASPAKYVSAGRLYIHRWPTGWQELIFSTDAEAQEWLAIVNVK